MAGRSGHPLNDGFTRVCRAAAQRAEGIVAQMTDVDDEIRDTGHWDAGSGHPMRWVGRSCLYRECPWAYVRTVKTASGATADYQIVYANRRGSRPDRHLQVSAFGKGTRHPQTGRRPAPGEGRERLDQPAEEPAMTLFRAG